MASIVVLGGGLAGLACAWKLRRAGHEVEVLERRPRHARDAAPLASDVGWLRAGDLDLRAAAAALDIPCSEGPGGSDAFVCNGRFETLPAPTLPAWLRAPGGSRRRRLSWAFSVRRALRPTGARAASLAAWDGASFEAVLAGALGDDPLAVRLGALVGLACREAPARLSYATGLAALASCRAAPRPVFLAGGLTALRDALAASVTIRWGCEAVDLESGSSGARVRYRTQGRMRSVLADAVVAALPAPELLRCCPKLTPEERGFFEAVEVAPTLSARLLLERAPLGLPGLRVGFPGREATLRSLVAVHRAPGAAPGGTGLLVACLSDASSRRLAAASDAEVQQEVLTALAATPLGRLRPRAFGVERAASPRPLFAPGAVARIARFERRIERSERVAFAGRHLCGPGPGAAFTSGLRAATAVARAFVFRPRTARHP